MHDVQELLHQETDTAIRGEKICKSNCFIANLDNNGLSVRNIYKLEL